MFGNTKPTASLSSGLLARKGQARPAMRPQGFHGTSLNLEDLGWDDMGEDAQVHAPAPVLAPVEPITPATVHPVTVAPVPPVLVEREALKEEFAPVVVATPLAPDPEHLADAPAATPVAVQHPPVRPVSVATAARISREVHAGKAKAAFTLRLDAERHLRLRLASACRNRSAQALVTEALDAFLESLPEVQPLVDQLVRAKTPGGKS